jgi:hypothetical protein
MRPKAPPEIPSILTDEQEAAGYRIEKGEDPPDDADRREIELGMKSELNEYFDDLRGDIINRIEDTL